MKNHLFLPTALLAVVTFSGCSTMPENNQSLNEARSDYSAAKNNPQVNDLAPNELKQAGDALEKANAASKENENEDVVTHLAYLAKQRVAIAQERAKQKEAETAVANASTERNRIRLDARTEEVSKAEKKAAASQREAESSQQQAAMAQQQSETSQQQTRDAEMRTSQLETQLKELNAKKTERGLVITLGDVLFDTNKAELKSGGTHSLQKLAGFLKQYPQRNVRIEGYTDSTGNADYNLELSGRRADAVRTSLVGMGVSNDRITTHGYGKESPVSGNDTASGRQMNRRVEIILSDDNSNTSLH
jgi:outer membrane protein OmpA-like peptidoglycan-associated protein